MDIKKDFEDINDLMRVVRRSMKKEFYSGFEFPSSRLSPVYIAYIPSHFFLSYKNYEGMTCYIPVSGYATEDDNDSIFTKEEILDNLNEIKKMYKREIDRIEEKGNK